jgi:tetrahydromethanopterin S-methyltransferase subunit G
METKIDNVQTQIHALDTRLIRVESRIEHIERQVSARVEAPVGRGVLMMFGLAMAVILALMIVVTWQVM